MVNNNKRSKEILKLTEKKEQLIRSYNVCKTVYNEIVDKDKKVLKISFTCPIDFINNGN